MGGLLRAIRNILYQRILDLASHPWTVRAVQRFTAWRARRRLRGSDPGERQRQDDGA